MTREELECWADEDLKRVASFCYSILANRDSARRAIERQSRKQDPVRVGCQADGDDHCEWDFCPQLRDGEPRSTGRHCPRDLRLERE